MTPEATVCGYAVDWLRACYVSAWRLTEDASVVTPGRYVFAPDNQPFYPGWHYLGSDIWTSDESPRELRGEIQEVRHKWFNGTGPNPFPLAQVVGKELELTEGGSAPLDCPPDPAIAGCLTDLGASIFLTVEYANGLFEGLNGQTFEIFKQPFVFYGTLDFPCPPSLGGGILRWTIQCDSGGVIVWLSRPSTAHDFFYLFPESWTIQDPLTPRPLVYSLIQEPDVLHGTINISVRTEPTPPPIDTRTFVAGFDKRCFIPQPAITPTLVPFPDLLTLSDQLQMAKVSAALYTSYAAAETIVQDWLGPGLTIDGVSDSASVVPGYLIAQRGDETYVVVSGTTNEMQVACYCLYGATAPQDLGMFSANLAWFIAAGIVASAVTAAGVNPNGRIILQGHSYGGAIAHLLGTMYLNANPDREVDLFTMGCPKVGDSRLVNILAPARKMRMANRGDIIVGLPPFLAEVLRTFPGIPLGIPPAFSFMEHCPGQTILESNGETLFSDESVNTFEFVQTLVTNALLNLPLTAGFPHSTTEYVRRLTLAAGA